MFELVKGLFGFKPYYKWITFNTIKTSKGLSKAKEF